MPHCIGLIVLMLGLAAAIMANPCAGAEPVILDTDIGSEGDDAFALGLLLASPELKLRGVTTVGSQAEDRAWIACRFLTQLDRRDVPVAFGLEPQPKADIGWQIQYRRHPGVVWGRTIKPRKASAVKLLQQKLKARPGKVTLLAIGPLTNIARLLREHPGAASWIRRIIWSCPAMAGGAGGSGPPHDVKAVRDVLSSGVPLVVVPPDATAGLKLDAERRGKLFAAHSRLTHQIEALHQLRDEPTPTLSGSLAVALAFEERFCKLKPLCLAVDDRGRVRAGKGKPNAHAAASVRGREFLDWYVERMASHGPTSLPKPPGNRSELVSRGGLPNRVHVFEDYDTDIEKRWWLAGRLEARDTPQSGRRACRAVLTQDFDDRMGDAKAMYRAVVFNPVPGPPMGKRTRLSFRYKLLGTDTIRVQLYSLSRGYHRYLSVSGLRQGRWSDAAVDMTKMRRPDGSGGPLSEDERIDDIQFYVDPRAELVIGDIVLYDAADEAQRRPFPRRFLFTGWFDTGEQGREWPGDFEIVKHRPPKTWKAARAVLNRRLGAPWLRVHLRGPRRLGERIRLRFRYHLSGGTQLRFALVGARAKTLATAEATGLAVGKWAEKSVDFRIPSARGRALSAEEIHIVAGKDAQLLIDDLLLYVPGP